MKLLILLLLSSSVVCGKTLSLVELAAEKNDTADAILAQSTLQDDYDASLLAQLDSTELQCLLMAP
jgi:hypothetical protein